MKSPLLFLLVPIMWPSEVDKNAGRSAQAAISPVPIVENLSVSARPASAVKEEPIRQIFYHPLIAYPELAFDGDEHQEQMDAWFVTTSEFIGSLETFHKSGFVLVDIREAYGKDENGRPVKRRLGLPPGKKPLILSVDDLNYYEYMKRNGTVHRLLVDDSGHLAEYTELPGRGGEISYDRSLPNLLESFVRLHPDFSYNGARGVIALTGYNGVFGYKTQAVGVPSYPKERDAAVKVAEKLKAMGWSFCSHTYFHRDLAKISPETLRRDTERWKTEVACIVGRSDVLIYPFGSRMPEDGPNFAYLRSQGFSIFLGASNAPYEKIAADHITACRLPIDGNALRGRYGDLSRFADFRNLFDATRGLATVRIGRPVPRH